MRGNKRGNKNRGTINNSNQMSNNGYRNNSNNNTKYAQVVQHTRGDSSNNYNNNNKLQTQDGSHGMYPRYSQTHSMTSGALPIPSQNNASVLLIRDSTDRKNIGISPLSESRPLVPAINTPNQTVNNVGILSGDVANSVHSTLTNATILDSMTDNNSFVGSYNYINNNINDASPRSLGGSILASIGGNSNFNNNFNNTTITNPNASTVTLGSAAVGAISASDMSIVFSPHVSDSIHLVLIQLHIWHQNTMESVNVI